MQFLHRRWRLILQVSLMIAAGWAIYQPVLQGDWLWDDVAEVPANPDLRSLEGLARIWTNPTSPDYFPLKELVQWIEWHLWGEARLGYHLTNLLLHLAGAFVLWRLLRQAGVRAAYFGGMIFLVHPLAVETVAWISELKSVLSLPLVLLAFSLFIQGRTRLALCLHLAALLCKTSGVMLPVLLLLHCRWSRGRVTEADWRRTAPFFALSVVLGAITLGFQHYRAIEGWHLYQGGFGSRLAQAGIALQFYAAKAVWPVSLLPIYPRWPVNPPAAVEFLPWLAVAAVAASAAWIGRRARGQSAALFGLAWFALNLLPVLGLLPMSYLHIAPAADHLAYLPLAGLAGSVAGLASLATGPESRRYPVWLGMGVLCALLAAASRNYAEKFVNQETLWAYAAPRNPASPAVHHNYGFVLRQSGRLSEAIREYGEAVRLAPDDAYAELDLADTLVAAGKRSEAITHYDRSIRLDPSLVQAHFRLADSLAKAGRRTDAIAEYEAALRFHPEYPDAENSLGEALAEEGRYDEAIDHYRKALRLQANFAAAENNLGLALARQARWNEAIADFEKALKLDPKFAKAHDNLGYALDAAGRLDESVAQFQEAVRLDPMVVEYHNNLGFALARRGRTAQAIEQFEAALRFKPDDAAAHFNLGAVLEMAGRQAEARAQFFEALRLDPGFSLARQHLQALGQ